MEMNISVCKYYTCLHFFLQAKVKILNMDTQFI